MPAVEPPADAVGLPAARSAWPATTTWSAIGADLEPGTLLAAYRPGCSRCRDAAGGTVGWWCPVDRGVLPLDGLRVSRSLRRSARRFEIRVDTAFEEVIDACADPRRPDGWIDDDVAARPTSACTGWAGRTRSRRGATAGWPAGCTASRSAGCSRGSRCSTASATRPRWRCVGLVDLLADEHAERTAARRAVGAPTTWSAWAWSSCRPTYLARLGGAGAPAAGVLAAPAGAAPDPREPP